MDAYIYQADLHCEDCAAQLKSQLKSPENPDDENTFDSDDYPKGPYPDGGGESDCPQHCSSCHCFLENPLTSDGYDYVYQQIKHEMGEVVNTWFDYYDFVITY